MDLLFQGEKRKESQLDRVSELAMEKMGIVNISGLSEDRIAHLSSLISYSSNRQCLIVTSSMTRAKKLFEDISFFTDKKVYLIPEEEQVFFKYDAKSHNYLEQRLTAIINMIKDKNCIIITSVYGALKKMIPPSVFYQSTFQLKVGSDIEMDQIKRKLSLLGYERSNIVESKGQYSIRGGIIDIFPIDSDNPYRIELFDTEVDSIRLFDSVTQRSIKNTSELFIYPAQQLIHDEAIFKEASKKIKHAYDRQSKRLEGEAKKRLLGRKDQIIEFIETGTNLQILENYIHYFYDQTAILSDYLNEDGIVIIDDPDRLNERMENFSKEFREDFQVIIEKGEAVPDDYAIAFQSNDLKQMVEDRLVFLFTPFVKSIRGMDELKASISISSKPTTNYSGRMDFFGEEIERYYKQKYRIILVCSTPERAQNINNFLSRKGLNSIIYRESSKRTPAEQIIIIEGNLSTGFEYLEDKVVVISDSDIFSNTKLKRTKTERKDAKPIKTFTDIKQGDYVVHENHGIGKFLGIEQLEIQNTKKDYLKIKYAGEDMLYVPVDQMDMVQKYIGADGTAPKINKLSSSEWKKTKAKVKEAINDMAKELLELNALRQMSRGYAFSKDTPWQIQFEDMFPYEETPDQLRCSEEIKKDMEKEIPMDRLLCGDVGYGKTEVAARAVFKSVADGKQAAVLVPTTILANQHYNTFKERFEAFPFTVEMLSRFRTDKQLENSIKKIKEGNIDVVIGTHRLLSKDVQFKDLGILIIDEEQRFGVQHKEAIKQLRKNVDVLALSATPIPRTLHMSLVGLRDMSIIEDPPEERYPVQTYVIEFDEEMIREAILREIERDGQVFFLYNRVKGIKKMAARIQELIPEASVTVAHGQMDEKELENKMLDFMDKKYNVLVCTTIIESGIDIPNVNTIIISDADKFGLSQLYQLRGRVGRSNRIAYAYLSYQKDKVLTEPAEKRLKAIKEFTEFGSGFRIAMRDLEIRGAGNLLGTEQHGHMMMIGYELYCKLLEETVKELNGEISDEYEKDSSIEIEINAYIPGSFISDELIKVEAYKKIAAVKSKEDSEEVADELIDRFGDIPKEVNNLILISYIKSICDRLGIAKISENKDKIVFEFHEKNCLDPFIISSLVTEYGYRVFINASKKPFIHYQIKNQIDKINEIKKLVEKIEAWKMERK